MGGKRAIDWENKTKEENVFILKKNACQDGVQNVCSHFFHYNGNLLGHGLKVRRGVNEMIAFFGIFSVISLFLGCYLPSIRLEIFGLLGLVLESGNQFEEAVS